MSPKISPLRKGKFSNPHNTQVTSLGLPHTFRAQCYIRVEQSKHIKLINVLPVTTLYFFPKKRTDLILRILATVLRKHPACILTYLILNLLDLWTLLKASLVNLHSNKPLTISFPFTSLNQRTLFHQYSLNRVEGNHGLKKISVTQYYYLFI